MTDDPKLLSDAALDRLFADAAGAAPAPSDALMARVLADAMDALPAPGGAQPRAGLLQGVFAAIGGWAGAGGLVTAGLVGLWFGIAPPAAIQSEAQLIWSSISPDLTGGWADSGDSL